MNLSRWIPWIAAVALIVMTGCQSSSCGNGGFMSRLTSRRGTVVYDGPVIGTPVSSMPYGECCEGGPMLGAPPFGYSTPIMQPEMGGSPILTVPPTTTLPSPTPSGEPPVLNPVPNQGTPPLAAPTPAQPSSRRRR